MFFNKRNRSEQSIIVHMGSASIAICLASFPIGKGAKPKVISSVRIPTNANNSLRNDSDSLLTKLFESAIISLTKEIDSKREILPSIEKNINSIHIIFSSPWHVSKTITIEIKNDKPFSLDEKMIDDLIEENEKKFENEAITGKFEVLNGKDINMIERELVRLKLNGYETSNSNIKEVDYAELSLYMTVAPHTLIEGVKKICERYFHNEEITFNSFVLASFRAIRHLFPHDNDFIILNIGGDATDISFVSDSILFDTKLFFSGRNHFLNKLSKDLNLSEEMALSLISSYDNGALLENQKQQFEKIKSDFIANWFNEYKLSTSTFKKSISGMRCFVTVDPDVSKIFLNHLNSEANGPIYTEITSALFLEKIDLPLSAQANPSLVVDTLFMYLHKSGL